tara:strand:- start:165 stop:719 length:555 start_codon:yes stop_codon:yes gene_type:complete
MDRYQFEDAISAYLDNDLNLSERQVFEAYMDANPDAKELVHDIRATMQYVKALPKVEVSGTFMPNLYEQIKFEKNRPSKKIVEKPSKTLFGFTPLYAGVMTVLIASFITVSVNLWPDKNSNGQPVPAFTENVTNKPGSPMGLSNSNQSPTFVTNESVADTADTTIIKKKKFELNKNVQFVKDQR